MKRIVSIATIFTLITGVMFVAPVLPAVDGDVDVYAASGSGTAPTNITSRSD
jgi:hypothetical protein